MSYENVSSVLFVIVHRDKKQQPYDLHRLYTGFLAMLSCLTLHVIILWRQILWFKPNRQRNKQCFK